MVTGLILVGKLGHSDGNWLIYFLHLLLPLFVIWLAEQTPALDDLPLPISFLAILGICGSATFTSYHGLWSLRDLRQITTVWEEIDQLIRPRARVLGSPAITGLLVAQGREVLDSGHTGYFPLVNDPAALRLRSLTVPKDRVIAIWEQYCGHLRTLIRERQFDMIIQSPIDGHNNTEPSCFGDIPVAYRLSAEIPYHVPWVKGLKVWLPRTSE